MKTVNTNRLNQLWKEGVLPKIKAGVDEKIDVLDTKEEIEANTDEEKMAGALAVKGMFGEINSKLSSLFVEVSGTSTRTSIAALELKGFQITFPIPDGYQFHSVKSFYISGWSGLVLQGITVSKNNVVFNVYNTREVTRECIVTAIINCIVNT